MRRTIIRAGDQNRAVQQAAFNFDDMAVQAKAYLDKVRVEAGQILAAARQEAEAAKRRAEAEGRAAGQRHVAEMVQQQVAVQMATVLPAVGTRDANRARPPNLASALGESGGAPGGGDCRQGHPPRAYPPARAEFGTGPRELGPSCGKLLRADPPQSGGLPHPWAASGGGRAKEFAGLGTAEVVADSQVTRGGCRTETSFGVIDQQVEAQLARIEEDLT